jgi:hypothetical protein
VSDLEVRLTRVPEIALRLGLSIGNFYYFDKAFRISFAISPGTPTYDYKNHMGEGVFEALETASKEVFRSIGKKPHVMFYLSDLNAPEVTMPVIGEIIGKTLGALET